MFFHIGHWPTLNVEWSIWFQCIINVFLNRLTCICVKCVVCNGLKRRMWIQHHMHIAYSCSEALYHITWLMIISFRTVPKWSQGWIYFVIFCRRIAFKRFLLVTFKAFFASNSPLLNCSRHIMIWGILALKKLIYSIYYQYKAVDKIIIPIM